MSVPQLDAPRSSRSASPAQAPRTVIASWRRNSREQIEIAIDRYQDCDIIDIRCWYADGADELRPGRTGISLSVRHLPALAAGLGAALAEAERRGLIDAGGDHA